MPHICSFDYNKIKLTLCWITYRFPSQTLTRSMPIKKLSGSRLIADFREFDLKTIDESIAHALCPPSPDTPLPRSFLEFSVWFFNYWSVEWEKWHPNSWPAHPHFLLFIYNSLNSATYGWEHLNTGSWNFLTEGLVTVSQQRYFRKKTIGTWGVVHMPYIDWRCILCDNCDILATV